MTQFARYTLLGGSRAEGMVVYTDSNGEPTMMYSHHDSDVNRGSSNAFDAVRRFKFGHLDAEVPAGTPITEHPSYKAMCDFAKSLPEVQAQLIAGEFEALPPLTPEEHANKTDVTVQKSRFRIVPAEEFAMGPPLAWIIKTLLPKAEVGMIFGEAGVGKSFLAYDLAASVSRGESWQALKTKQGRAIYIPAEGAGGFKKRMSAYAQKHGVSLTKLPGVVPAALNLLEVEHVLDLTREIVAQGPADLIVVDTMAAATPGGDENSGEAMGQMLQHCKAMHKATGALVLLIHHSGKDATKGARGWSGIRGAMDVMIEVTRNGDFRLATVYKMKDGEDGQSWNFKLSPVVLGIDEDGEEITSCVIEVVAPPENMGPSEPKSALGKSILRLLKNMGDPCNIAELLDAAIKTMPLDAHAKRDQRRAIAKKSLDLLLAQKFLYLHGESQVSTTSATPASTEEFDEKAQA